MRFIARQVKRLLIGLGILAGVMAAAVPATQLWLRVRFEEMKRKGIPGGPELEQPGDERSMSDIFSRLEQVPFKPLPTALGMIKGGLNNNVFLLLNATRSTTCLMYPYPEEFEQVTIESFDGAPLRVAVGLHKDGKPRPGLVISHGFMGSKNDHYIVDAALTAYAGWGFNVLGIDLRNFGESQRFEHTPTTAGWKEGEDLLAAAKYLSEQPDVTSVGITGFSMGAGSTMRAAYATREYPYLTGGAIAWNGYSDSRRMIEYISTKPDSITDPFYPVHLSFRLMHKLRRQDMKGYIDDPEILSYLDGDFDQASFVKYVEEISAPHYGVDTDELYRNSSPKEFLADVEVPLLVVHAEDDPVCPPSEMEDLREIVASNPNVNVWMLPVGNHCMFRYMDRNWFENVMRRYFEYWARWE